VAARSAVCFGVERLAAVVAGAVPVARFARRVGAASVVTPLAEATGDAASSAVGEIAVGPDLTPVLGETVAIRSERSAIVRVDDAGSVVAVDLGVFADAE